MTTKECTCDTEHSITKLGHCADCPHFHVAQQTQVDQSLRGCANRDLHSDGTPHDFDWASYSDERVSSGVCRCGLLQINYDMAWLP